MLVVAKDTVHANDLEAIIKSDDFFEGRYRDRVITVHSNQTGEEKDEVVERLLAVEDPKEPTEIVIHVNMLKEGWDVTNLYTIVPLRAAHSETLVQQSIGRGLRLPYGKRTGVKSIDRLTIVAHDRFQEILDSARNPRSAIYSLIREGITIEPDGERREVWVARPAAEIALAPRAGGAEESSAPAAIQETIVFPTPADQAIAQTTLEVIRRVARPVTGAGLKSAADLTTPEVLAQIVQQVQQIVAPSQGELEGMGSEEQVRVTVQKAVEMWVEKSMDIPRIVIQPIGDTDFGYDDFDLDVAHIAFQPVSQDILLAYLRTDERERLNADVAFKKEKRLEDYIVRNLWDYNDITYDDQADLLYKLAGQMVAHLRTLHHDEDTLLNVVRYHERKLAELIHAQMQSHVWTKETGFEVTVTQGVTTLRENNYTRPAGEAPVNFRAPVDEKQFIRSILFGGFRKCLYQVQKFDSDPERRFAVILENDDAVEKWFKPAKSQFQIFYRHAHQEFPYEPDFAVETKTEKLLCEPKRATEMTDEVVFAKARAAIEWCKHATAHAQTHGGKPWSYLLIPHDVITASATLDGLTAAFRTATA
jgi:type III restriction enzyme